MVVGREDPWDVTYRRRASLTVRGKTYSGFKVYGDKRDPSRRDIFAPRKGYNLPAMANVKYQGNIYGARLSFRAGRQGSKIPVYTWRVGK